jgi:CheY-like chemotaxis protein
LSKLAESKVKLKSVPFSPKQVVQSACNMLASQAKQQHDLLVLDLPEDDIIVKGDPDRMMQIILNLLSNAIKFTSHGKVELKLRVENLNENSLDLIALVKDNGIGISEDEQKRLFGRFAQASSSSQYCGSGLGLYISNEIAKMMGGSITLQSQIGKGTEVIFRGKFLRLGDDEVDKFLREKSPESTSTSKKRKMLCGSILIVEDNLINQKILAKFLSDCGFPDYKLAANGKEAVEMHLLEGFDLIFMDVEMPVMNGLEATQQIRQKEKEFGLQPVSIIGVSGYSRNERQLTSLSLGMDAYITKPFHKQDIVNILEKFLPP